MKREREREERRGRASERARERERSEFFIPIFFNQIICPIPKKEPSLPRSLFARRRTRRPFVKQKKKTLSGIDNKTLRDTEKKAVLLVLCSIFFNLEFFSEEKKITLSFSLVFFLSRALSLSLKKSVF